MNTLKRAISVFFLFASSLQSISFAQQHQDGVTVGGLRGFTYQGTIVDKDARPLSGKHRVSIKLYSSPTAAEVLHEEKHLIDIHQGVFNLEIGSSTPMPLELLFDKQYWLGISFNDDAELTPRSRLSSVPTSIHAISAGNLLPGADGAVTMLNGLSGELEFKAGPGTRITSEGKTITISSAVSGAGKGSETLGAKWEETGGNAAGSTAFVGTNNNSSLRLQVKNNTAINNSLILNNDGSIQRDASGNSRGSNALDLQSSRSSATQVASGTYSVIVGGKSNNASSSYSVIGGGELNESHDPYTVVAGGYANRAQENYATVGGGNTNAAAGYTATIAGGDHNTASGSRATISGGQSNAASASYSSIVGGFDNSVAGDYSATLGGRGLTLAATADNSVGFNANGSGVNNTTITAANTAYLGNVDLWIGNNDNSARSLRFYESHGVSGAFPNGSNYVGLKAPTSVATDLTLTLPGTDGTGGQVLSTDGSSSLGWTSIPSIAWALGSNDLSGIDGSSNVIGSSATSELKPVNIVVNGNRVMRYEDGSAPNLIGGHKNNAVVSGKVGGVIGGGGSNAADRNEVNDHYGVIVGGFRNRASNEAFVGGGRNHSASGFGSSVVGGWGNVAGGMLSHIAGGEVNHTFGRDAAVGGGFRNVAAGTATAIPGGGALRLDGNYSFGFLGNNDPFNYREATVAASNIAFFGNVDLWLGNNDGTAQSDASQLRLYAPSAQTGTYPNTTHYSAFRSAEGMTVDAVYTLPAALPASGGQVLAANTSGEMVWTSLPAASQDWVVGGNSAPTSSIIGNGATNGDLDLHAGGAARIVIDGASGYVGVGTSAGSTPDARLDIGGLYPVAQGIALSLGNGNPSFSFGRTQMTFGHAVSSGVTTVTRHRLATRHNSAGGAGNAFDFYTWSPLQGQFDLGEKLGLTIEDGKVGIGMYTPTQKLDVSGSIQFTGLIMPDGNAGTTGQVGLVLKK